MQRENSVRGLNWLKSAESLTTLFVLHDLFFKGSDSTQQYNLTVVSCKNVSLREISCDNVKIQKQIPFAEGSALCVWWSDSHLELITMLPMWAGSI